MNHIFATHLRKFVLVFFDDILVYSKTWADHVSHLRVVLEILVCHRFFIKPSKCTFAQEELEYLGRIISREGVKVDQRKIEAMQSWPQPKNITALRGFLGLTGYYRKFVEHYGLIAKPLTEMLKKGKFGWNSMSMAAFQALKDAMTCTPVLAMPNFNEVFEVHTDACDEGIGAALTQQGRPLAYLSKMLGPMKRGWSVYSKEMLAVSEAIRVWQPYLIGQKFRIYTYQQPLKHLLEQRIVTLEQQKFIAKLLGFEFEIHYRLGKENVVADALSRRTEGPILTVVTELTWHI